MRGTPMDGTHGDTMGGIIPADAGNTQPADRHADRAWDHPRGCGEHLRHRSPLRRARGSSPRMRGTPGQVEGILRHLRIIPADAGNTRPGRRWIPCRWDHPRGCGEHHPCPPGFKTVLGSSPRMRGTRLRYTVTPFSKRIIPADAGNTFVIPSHKVEKKDHPRGCGEHASGHPNCLCVTGSSPRMRGTPPFTLDSILRNGIIPADAGNTIPRLTVLHRSQDHPRGCGEHSESHVFCWP